MHDVIANGEKSPVGPSPGCAKEQATQLFGKVFGFAPMYLGVEIP